VLNSDSTVPAVVAAVAVVTNPSTKVFTPVKAVSNVAVNPTKPVLASTYTAS